MLNDALIGPDDFHGAKFYAELAPVDVSNLYLDAVQAHFDDVRADVDRDWPAVAAGDRTPTFAGWAAVERIARFLERRPGVGVHRFRPQVAVIARRIAVGREQVLELRHAVPHHQLLRHADFGERRRLELVRVDHAIGHGVDLHVDDRRRQIFRGGKALVERP